MKIVSIVGARPQFIKCAPVSRELRKENQEILVHTGQHYDANMSDVFFEQLNIPKPDYHLNIGSASHGEQTGKMLIEIEKVLITEKPDMVLVYGDTNSTLAGALAASKLHIPVAHVEAGLRSFDRTMPEEINRIMTDHISDLLFCPTQTAVDNLAKEGITQGSNASIMQETNGEGGKGSGKGKGKVKVKGKGVYLTGDVMFDALRYNLKIAEDKSTILKDLNLTEKNYFVATVHRPSNTDIEENLRNIIGAFSEIIKRSSCPTIFPVHPRTVKFLKSYGLYENLPENLILLEPLPYLDMLLLMSKANKIMTDSGGIQKEAYILNIPCITLRENTEWVETLQGGRNILTGADREKIVQAVFDCETDKLFNSEIFGKGDSAVDIVSEIASFYSENT
ncbi:UDP-N-acetyl glucosamine 2-epimerase [Methanomicrobium antiquum]|uniref:UDP-N-acetyl glucosamine 2-epimerase n=1 Tax=Methanomicrobium antiquum TaxID=487686 RepID=A0AAF0FRZ1_9EURY|nr:UDP-N-acetyl glucosamine 2-epimerase [Methanomicrobium antiquum]WFN37409.1 UDP-N-acetyl glucosamine 2-epimerase [Methanomicrobium antiquum]